MHQWKHRLIYIQAKQQQCKIKYEACQIRGLCFHKYGSLVTRQGLIRPNSVTKSLLSQQHSWPCPIVVLYTAAWQHCMKGGAGGVKDEHGSVVNSAVRCRQQCLLRCTSLSRLLLTGLTIQMALVLRQNQEDAHGRAGRACLKLFADVTKFQRNTNDWPGASHVELA